MSGGCRWDRRDWLILAGLLALSVLAWSRVLFKPQWTFGVGGDFLRQFYPQRYFAVRSISSGTFPLWYPNVLCGQAFFASYQTAMLYPPNLLMLVTYAVAGADFPLKAQCWFVALHFFMAGAFTYLLARDLGTNRTGAAVAAVSFMFCGFMVAHSGHTNQISAAAWLPLILMLFFRALRRRRLSWALAAGVATAVALLAGHLQSVFYACVLMLGLLAFAAVMRFRGEPLRGGILFGVCALALTVVLGAALASAQLIPTYQLIRLSTRSSIPYQVAAQCSLPRWQLVSLVFPKFFGENPDSYFGGWLMWELYGYAGIVAGALAVVAVLNRKRRPMVVFLWAALVVSVLLALGPGGGLFTLLFKSHLFFDRFHDPARVLLIYGLATALLAGLGADHLVSVFCEGCGHRRYRAALGLVAALVALLLLFAAALSAFMLARADRRGPRNEAGWKSMVLPCALMLSLLFVLWISERGGLEKPWLSMGLVALVVLDVLLINVPWVMVQVDPQDPYGDAGASRFVASQQGSFRVETDASNMYMSLDNGALYGLDKSTGDDSLTIAAYSRYREIIFPQVRPGVTPSLFHEGALRSPMLDCLSDAYFLTRSPIDPRLLAGEGSKFELLEQFGGVYVYRNNRFMPRAWMTDCVAYEENSQVDAELSRTRGSGLRETALVVMPGKAASRIPAIKSKLRVVEYSPHRMTIHTGPECRGLLFTPEVDYPGWEVRVDGRRKPILRTNLAFRGVMLEGGQSTVEFVFRPGIVRKGALISVAALVFLAAWCAAGLAARAGRRREADFTAAGSLSRGRFF